MKNNRLKNAKAITLIALVVTIIVLLILAGVSVMMLTGDNGILTNAQQTSTQSTYKGAEEQVELAYMAVKTEIMAKTAQNGAYNPKGDTARLANIVRKDLGLAENDTAGNGKWKVEEDSTKGKIKITYTDSKIDQGVMGEQTITMLGDTTDTVAIPREEGVIHFQINLLDTQDAKLYVDTAGDGVAETPPVDLISFSVGGITYHAENGMTWEQWMASEYNTSVTEYTLDEYIEVYKTETGTDGTWISSNKTADEARTAGVTRVIQSGALVICDNNKVKVCGATFFIGDTFWGCGTTPAYSSNGADDWFLRDESYTKQYKNMQLVDGMSYYSYYDD